jgi:poly(A) polymerase
VVEPVIIPRAKHQISRRDIDADALKVLYRLREHNYTAYLVGGGVRDLLLGRRPKDFDIGTDAHPYQIKKLFRNCWIIGRRFRLAHVKFGPKTIEVATFRKNVPDMPSDPPIEETTVVASAPEPEVAASNGDPGPMHRDNTFGTPEEDAFRRDFTVNGLFYDIATFSVIDYVGGLDDLEQRVLRSIGDPRVRFVEDPVRMMRAAVFAARLGFDMDPAVVDAISEHRKLITEASPSRLLEEYYKILRSGYAEASFRALGKVRLLELVTPELKTPSDAVWDSLARLDAYRQRFPTVPPELTTAILMGALVAPLGLLARRTDGAPPVDRRGRLIDRVNIGMLPVARRDLERLRHVMQILPRLADLELPPRVARSMPQRPAFDDSLTWMELFGDTPEIVEEWRAAKRDRAKNPAEGDAEADPPATEGGASARPRRRRRRRRGGRGRGGGNSGGPAAT